MNALFSKYSRNRPLRLLIAVSWPYRISEVDLNCSGSFVSECSLGMPAALGLAPSQFDVRAQQTKSGPEAERRPAHLPVSVVPANHVAWGSTHRRASQQVYQVLEVQLAWRISTPVNEVLEKPWLRNMWQAPCDMPPRSIRRKLFLTNLLGNKSRDGRHEKRAPQRDALLNVDPNRIT